MGDRRVIEGSTGKLIGMCSSVGIAGIRGQHWDINWYVVKRGYSGALEGRCWALIGMCSSVGDSGALETALGH